MKGVGKYVGSKNCFQDASAAGMKKFFLSGKINLSDLFTIAGFLTSVFKQTTPAIPQCIRAPGKTGLCLIL